MELPPSWAAYSLASTFRLRHARSDSLPQHLPLKFGYGAEYLKSEPACWQRGIHVLF